MQLQFREIRLNCLQRLKWELREQEQTQEIRVSEGLPDIGRVLGAWGQVILRSKDWRSGSAGVSGGVMVWVLYCPESGTQVCCVDTWIPFQVRWDIPETPRDGSLLVSALLRSVDARSTSARKLMVRACVSFAGEAVVPGEVTLYEPDQMPKDVQLLVRTYPMTLPAEAGEKPFQIDETLQMPTAPAMRRILRYDLQPEIIDQRILAGKAVFRGAVNVRMIYEGEDGMLHCKDYETSFSQFAELEKDFDEEAQLRLIPAVTSLEMEQTEDGMISLKAGLLGQYMVFDRREVQIVEDAYSPYRQVNIQEQEASLPAVLDRNQDKYHPVGTVEALSTAVADVTFFPTQPVVNPREDGAELSMSGAFQVLYYDHQGMPQCQMSAWQESRKMPADPNAQIQALCAPSGRPSVESGNGIQIRADVLSDVVTAAREGIRIVSELELGEEKKADPARPSLVLCRPEGASLWELAKKHGSTMDAIRAANKLSEDSLQEKVLLIPVL